MVIRILLAEDHTLFRSGLGKILEEHERLEVVAEASTGLDAVALARQHQPDVALLDIRMRELSGLEAAAQIRKCSPQTAIMILSVHGDERYIVGSVKAGARGYVLKDFSPAAEKILRSRRYRAPVAQGVDDPYGLLTDCERQHYQRFPARHTHG